MAKVITGTLTETYEIVVPEVEHLVTEDDTPVDNLFSEKQQRLLIESLYTSWQRTFLAAANVAIYYGVHQPAIVPDVLVSLDVNVADDWFAKEHRSYFVWEFGKVPELIVEIVSNKVGEELTHKFERYAQIGVDYYVVLDPTHQWSEQTVRAFVRNLSIYRQLDELWFERLQLGVRLWQGRDEEKDTTWLRWCDREGNLLLTGIERAEQERARAEQERARAEQERARAERLAEKLRALGIEPE